MRSCSPRWSETLEHATQTVCLQSKNCAFWYMPIAVLLLWRWIFWFALHFLRLYWCSICSTRVFVEKHEKLQAACYQTDQSLGGFWCSIFFATNFTQREPETSRNHCQAFGKFSFLPSNCWLYHIQYHKQLLNNVCMMSHEKPHEKSEHPEVSREWDLAFHSLRPNVVTCDKSTLAIAQWMSVSSWHPLCFYRQLETC